MNKDNSKNCAICNKYNVNEACNNCNESKSDTKLVEATNIEQIAGINK